MREWDYSPGRPPPNTGAALYRPGPPDDVAPWLVWPADAVRLGMPVGGGTNRKAALRDARRRVGPGGAPLAVSPISRPCRGGAVPRRTPWRPLPLPVKYWRLARMRRASTGGRCVTCAGRADGRGRGRGA